MLRRKNNSHIIGRLNSMDKEHIKKLAKNKQFIAGIYNYCDRWCDRCPLTSRCMNFEIINEQFAGPETRDINNEAFWQKLSETFQMTLDMLKETAEREGIDLDAFDMEEAEEQESLNQDITENHECSRTAKAYGDMVDDWFDSASDLFEQKEDELNQNKWLEMPNVNSFGKSDSFEEALQVVRWYQHQIYVKLMRAIHGNLEERLDAFSEFPKDSDGSAKIALIGIDRSIAAWGEIRNHFPLYDASILKMLVHLEQLRRKVEKAFPDARAFMRPGFDKIDLNS
jgi:hypothetical protein